MIQGGRGVPAPKEERLWHFSTAQYPFCRLWWWPLERALGSGGRSTFWKATATTIPEPMLMYGKEASNRKQEIDRQYHTIPNQRNQRPKDKHRGNVYNLLFRHGKVRSQNMEKLKCSFPTFCKQTFPQLHKIASYAHYAQCRLLRNPSFSISFKSYLFVLWNIGQPPFCHSIKDRQ